MTQYHLIPSSTKLYWPSTTMYQPVPPHTDSVSYIFFYDSFYECCLRKAIFVAFHFDPIKVRFLSLVKSKSSLVERLVPHWDLSQGGPIKKDTLHQKPFGWRPSSKLRTIPGRVIRKKKDTMYQKVLGWRPAEDYWWPKPTSPLRVSQAAQSSKMSTFKDFPRAGFH